MNPHIEQDKRQGPQHEAIGRIAARRPAPYAPGTAIARLDAKPFPVQLSRGTGGEGHVNEDEDQPLRPPPQAFGPLGRGEHVTDGHRGGELRPVLAAEGMRGAVTPPPLTQRAGPARRATDGTGDKSWLRLAGA